MNLTLMHFYVLKWDGEVLKSFENIMEQSGKVLIIDGNIHPWYKDFFKISLNLPQAAIVKRAPERRRITSLARTTLSEECLVKSKLKP